jgi:hypothetical protein
VRCNEACGIFAGGRLHVDKRVYRLRRLGTLAPAGKRVRIKVALGSKARRAIRGGLEHHRRIRVDVNLRARDAAGNRSKLATKTVRVKR